MLTYLGSAELGSNSPGSFHAPEFPRRPLLGSWLNRGNAPCYSGQAPVLLLLYLCFVGCSST